MKKPYLALVDIWIDGRIVPAGSSGITNPLLMMTDKQASAYRALGQIELVVVDEPVGG